MTCYILFDKRICFSGLGDESCQDIWYGSTHFCCILQNVYTCPKNESRNIHKIQTNTCLFVLGLHSQVLVAGQEWGKLQEWLL